MVVSLFVGFGVGNSNGRVVCQCASSYLKS